jgi:hypothetical protein
MTNDSDARPSKSCLLNRGPNCLRGGGRRRGKSKIESRDATRNSLNCLPMLERLKTPTKKPGRRDQRRTGQISIFTTMLLDQSVLRQAIAELSLIHQHGQQIELEDRLAYAYREMNRQSAERTIGEDFRARMLGSDLARYAKLPQQACIDAAKSELTPGRSDVALAEIRQLAQEIQELRTKPRDEIQAARMRPRSQTPARRRGGLVA